MLPWETLGRRVFSRQKGQKGASGWTGRRCEVNSEPEPKRTITGGPFSGAAGKASLRIGEDRGEQSQKETDHIHTLPFSDLESPAPSAPRPSTGFSQWKMNTGKSAAAMGSYHQEVRRLEERERFSHIDLLNPCDNP
uniref:Uncharacterized protein n=1 Tax=Mustela putorius furo TaxID=9669 RepID=M3YZ53_MUSPF